ncbi:MAG: hypothetical protein C0418_05430 [Coriobacteriaceae bacterium]|nr:hypothetical protein [Coriobacteriaceae bacterium]
MTRAKARLALSPERCDSCGRCEAACPEHALKVGSGYLFVDWARCDGCGECAEVCDRGAIERLGLPPRRGARGGEEPKAVPGRTVVRTGAEPPESGAAAPAYLRAALSGPDASASPAPDAPAGGWSLGEAAGLLTIMLALVMAKDTVLSVQAVRALPLEAVVWIRALVLAVYYALAVTFLLWLARRGGGSASERLRLQRPGERSAGGWLRAAGAVAGLLVLTRLATTGYVALAFSVGWEPPGPGEAEFVRLFGSSASGLLISAALVVLVAPVVEEAVFRGAVLGALGRYLPRWGAIVASALLFAVLHLDAWMFVPTFVLGLALGWLGTRRATLWPAVVMHALYNATAVAAAYLVLGSGAPPV